MPASRFFTLCNGWITAICWTVHEPEWQRALCCTARLATNSNSGCPDRVVETTLVAMQDLAGQQAANDIRYLPPRHRTLPVLASVSPIANYPAKLRIFKTMASRYWQVRCFLKGRTHTQSLKTTNKQAAISQAKQFFHIKTAELYSDHVTARSDKGPKFADLLPNTSLEWTACRWPPPKFTAKGRATHCWMSSLLSHPPALSLRPPSHPRPQPSNPSSHPHLSRCESRN